MSIARVTELSATSETSFEDAINEAVARATRTLRGVEGAWVKDMNISIEDGNIKGYRVNLEVTFQLEDPDKDDHQRERDGPPKEDGTEPGDLVEDRSQRVPGHRRRVVLVDKPDHKRRNWPEKSRKEIQERAQMSQRRPRALVLEAHHTRPGCLELRAVLALDPVVPRVSLHVRSFLTVANRVYADARRRFRLPCGRFAPVTFRFPSSA